MLIHRGRVRLDEVPVPLAEPGGVLVEVDIELGQKIGATTLLVRTGYDMQLGLQLAGIYDYVVDNLANAAAVIEHPLKIERDFINWTS